jgi:hypothetical protein
MSYIALIIRLRIKHTECCNVVSMCQWSCTRVCVNGDGTPGLPTRAAKPEAFLPDHLRRHSRAAGVLLSTELLRSQIGPLPHDLPRHPLHMLRKALPCAPDNPSVHNKKVTLNPISFLLLLLQKLGRCIAHRHLVHSSDHIQTQESCRWRHSGPEHQHDNMTLSFRLGKRHE